MWAEPWLSKNLTSSCTGRRIAWGTTTSSTSTSIPPAGKPLQQHQHQHQHRQPLLPLPAEASAFLWRANTKAGLPAPWHREHATATPTSAAAPTASVQLQPEGLGGGNATQASSRANANLPPFSQQHCGIKPSSTFTPGKQRLSLRSSFYALQTTAFVTQGQGAGAFARSPLYGLFRFNKTPLLLVSCHLGSSPTEVRRAVESQTVVAAVDSRLPVVFGGVRS